MTKEITKIEPKEVVNVKQSPVELLLQVADSGMDIEKLDRLLELQAKYDAMEAKKAYTKAMAEFKAMPLRITKDKDNKQYNSKYTTLGNLVNTTTPLMSKVGLSHKWIIDQSQQISVSCVVTHNLGHSETTTMSAPPDGSGSKNPIQQIKSTITYLKSATFESAMGLASSDANFDDDGNAAGLEFISPDQVKIVTNLIKSKGVKEKDVFQFCNCETVDTITQNIYKPLISKLKAKKVN